MLCLASCGFDIGDVLVIAIFIILYSLHVILAIGIILKIYKVSGFGYSPKEERFSTAIAFAFLCLCIILYCVCRYSEKLCKFCENIGIFGIMCAFLLGASVVIGMVMCIRTYYRGNLKDQNYNPFFFFTFLNLIILLGFAVSDFCRKNKVSDFCRKNKVKIEKPTDVTYDTKSVTHNSFKVQWKPGPASESNSQNLKFFLEWYSQNRKEGDQTIPYNGNGVMECVIKNLKSSTNYTVKIQAVNDKGDSAFTNPLEVRTLVNIEKPTDVTYDTKSVTHNSFKVQWKPGPASESNSQNLKFFLEWFLRNRKKGDQTIPYNGNGVMECVIKNLKPSTKYTVKIQAVNDKGHSAFTNPLEVRTLAKLGKPTEVTYDKLSVTYNSFKVQWKPGPASESNPQNLKFFLEWYSQNRKEGDQTIPYNGKGDMEYVIQNLKSSTNYTVKIQAVNDKGYSAFTNPLEVRTLEKLTFFRQKHKQIAGSGEDKICCKNCKKTGAFHASHTYGLSHELYLCLDCLKKEHRDEECVILLNTGNLFYCNLCQPDELNPVECYDLKSLELRCWKCYILNIKSSTVLSYPDEVTSKLHENSDMNNPCQVHEHEDDTMSTTPADVYCLVCKSNMCDSCFKKHIIKKQKKLKPMSR